MLDIDTTPDPESGSTGLDLTGEVSDLFMLWWDAQFSKALESLLVKSDLSLRFKDDINIIADKIPLAHSLIHKYFGNDCMSHLSEISQTELTAKLFCAIVNEIDPMVQFTYDVPELNPDGKLPVLDLKVFMSPENEVLYEVGLKYLKRHRKHFNRKIILFDQIYVRTKILFL